MAIHVRPRSEQQELIERSRRRAMAVAISTASTVLVMVGLILFLIRFLILQEGPPHFIAYVNGRGNESAAAEGPRMQELASSAPPPLQPVTPTVIVADALADMALEDNEISLPDFDFGTPLADIGQGLLPQSLGPGSSMGGGGGGGLGNDLGLNDDIQVVLALDASGSMERLFTQVSQSLHEILAALQACKLNGRDVKVNVGIVSYGQGMESGKPRELSPFSLDHEAQRAQLAGVSCDGGYECCGEAIKFCIEHYPWNLRARDNVLKIIFIAGNEEFSQGEVDYRAAMMMARERNIIVNTIHCGGPNEEWQAAARLGDGIGFDINLHPQQYAAPGSAEILRRSIALCRCEAIPFGSPQERRKRLQELPALVKDPSEQEAASKEWRKGKGRELIQGYDWDAVEICRREGPAFKLSMLGGLPNLPQELRAKGEAGALMHLQNAARMRQASINHYLDLFPEENGLCGKVLKVIQTQAAAKGIKMEL